MVLNSAITFLNGNPAVLWMGIILAILLFLVTRHLERMKSKEEELEPPSPTSLDEIVRPKVVRHLQSRGKEPKTQIVFKIGREPQGTVKRYLDTRMESKLLNPNPNTSSSDDSSSPSDDDFTDVRIVMTGKTGILNALQEFLVSILGTYDQQEDAGESIYVFRKSSFLNTPGDDMVLDPDVLSYDFAGMEVEIDPSTRNVVNQAVQGEVSEQLLSALPNYTEKVDFLFPLHSQKMKSIEQEGEHLQGEENF